MSPTATAIPPTHVPCVAEWPALSPSRISSHETDGDWELLSELQDESSTSTSTSAQTQTQTQTSFEREAVRIVEQFLDTENSTASATKITTPFCLKHAQSSPNFHTILEESDDNDAVLVGTTGNSNSNSTSTSQPEDGVGSLASSSMVMVPESPSLVSTESSWSTVSKISFRDAIMKEKPQETNHNANNNNNNNNHASEHRGFRQEESSNKAGSSSAPKENARALVVDGLLRRNERRRVVANNFARYRIHRHAALRKQFLRHTGAVRRNHTDGTRAEPAHPGGFGPAQFDDSLGLPQGKLPDLHRNPRIGGFPTRHGRGLRRRRSVAAHIADHPGKGVRADLQHAGHRRGPAAESGPEPQGLEGYLPGSVGRGTDAGRKMGGDGESQATERRTKPSAVERSNGGIVVV
mmetsp:Transcript_23282/g.50895  ORF Transcript_23282/g.50895 Transcript_23282/m.50895 type:complete len:408 (+) Transcript_23282:205-1428(+)